MQANFHVANAGDHVRVRIGNPVTAETVDACVVEAVKVAVEITTDGRAHFLVDFRGTYNQDSLTRTFWYFREEFPRHPLLKSSRIALIVDPHETTYDFVETTAQNAGFEVQRFLDEHAAMAWLLPHRAVRPIGHQELGIRP